MSRWSRVLFGISSGDDHEELHELRYRLIMVLVFFGCISSTLFLFADHTGANKLPALDILAIRIHLAMAVVVLVLLRLKKAWLYPLSIVYELLCIYVFVSALVWVPSDELRILWFYLNIPTVYLILGRYAGVLVTIASIAIVAVANQYSVAPYSPNAISTGLATTVYLSGVFYVFSDRMLSFYVRMVQSNEQLRYMATHDPLTGVLNTRTYNEVAERLLTIAQRDKQPHSVLFIDLDHFKCINDTYGHDAGDAVLKTVAKTIQEACRASDILGRVGGEEFSLFLPNTTREGALQLAEKIRVSIEALCPKIGALEHRVTASIGIAAKTESTCFAAIQKEADQAMYTAKQQGRNCVRCLFG